MTDVNALLANAQRAELPVEIYLGSPVIVHRRIDLQQQAERSPEDEAELDDLVRQMHAATLTTRVRAIPHRQWDKLVVDNPPREGNANDKREGFNTSSFYAAVVPLCLPDLTRDQYEKLDAVISEGEWDKVCGRVQLVNTHAVIVPFLPADSSISPGSDETSKPPNDSASV
jgi:hypothetical protein